MINMLKILGFSALGLVLLTNASFSKQVRNDMSFTCKYEAKRNYGVSQGSSRTDPVEKTRNGFKVYGQSPRNTKRALFYECKFNRYGEYRSIKKTRDNRYSGGGHANNRPSKTARRICKGEASARWRTRPNYIKINSTKRSGRNNYIVQLSSRGQRGVCEVSSAGHIYSFRTRSAQRPGSSVTPREARSACARRAASRWGTRLDRVRVTGTKRLGRDDFNVRLAYRNHRAECEVSGRGRIYLFSEY